MLESIRSNAQSWVVKLAFGLIILVFVFWGVGSFTGGAGTAVVTVNDHGISQLEVERTRYTILQQLRSQSPDMPESELENLAKNLGLRQEAVRQLIVKTLIQQEAQRTGITVTPLELRKMIETLSVFHNAEGRFDPTIYTDILGQQGMTPGQFEKEISYELLTAKMQEELTAGVSVAETQAQDLLRFLLQTRTVEYLPFAISDFEKDILPDETAMQAWYDDNPTTFSVPAKADVEYLLIGNESLAATLSVDEAAVEAYYEKNSSQYTHDERVQARHILIMPDTGNADQAVAEAEALATINALYQRLQAGEDFATLAKAYSQDGSAAGGGDLGWFERQEMVTEFADAAFALQEGALSAPVKTMFGYHLIKTEKKEAAGQRAFEDVRADIVRQLSLEQATASLQEVLDQIRMAVIGGKNLTDAGSAFKLQPAKTGLMSAAELVATLNITAAEAQTLLTMKPNTIKETPYTTPNGYILVNVQSATPQKRLPYAEVKEEIKTMLSQQKAQELAQNEAQKQLETIAMNPLPQIMLDKIQTISDLNRQGAAGTLGILPNEQVQKLFELERNVWLQEPVLLAEGPALMRVVNIKPPSDDIVHAEKQAFAEQLTQEKRNQMFNAVLSLLQEKATIHINESALLNE